MLSLKYLPLLPRYSCTLSSGVTASRPAAYAALTGRCVLQTMSDILRACWLDIADLYCRLYDSPQRSVLRKLQLSPWHLGHVFRVTKKWSETPVLDTRQGWGEAQQMSNGRKRHVALLVCLFDMFVPLSVNARLCCHWDAVSDLCS